MAKRVKKRKNVEITEDNCKQVLLVYAMQRYPQEMENTIPDCPYKLGGLDSELAFNEFAEWFISERIQPSTGKTVVREFVEKYSQLKSRFDDEITRGWDEDPPKSTIGIIRLHALLIVGKIGISGRMYKIAVVPLELREVIERYI